MRVHIRFAHTCNVFRLRRVIVRMPYLPSRKAHWPNSFLSLSLYLSIYVCVSVCQSVCLHFFSGTICFFLLLIDHESLLPILIQPLTLVKFFENTNSMFWEYIKLTALFHPLWRPSPGRTFRCCTAAFYLATAATSTGAKPSSTAPIWWWGWLSKYWKHRKFIPA